MATLRELGALPELPAGPALAASPHRAATQRAIARELIVRLLSSGPRTAEDLRSDVLAADLSQETFHRARAELTAQA